MDMITDRPDMTSAEVKQEINRTKICTLSICECFYYNMDVSWFALFQCALVSTRSLSIYFVGMLLIYTIQKCVG